MENPVINYTGDYIPARVSEYEPLKLQLDKLWHDIDAVSYTHLTLPTKA